MYSFILLIDLCYLILILKNLNFNSFFLYMFKCLNASKQCQQTLLVRKIILELACKDFE